MDNLESELMGKLKIQSVKFHDQLGQNNKNIEKVLNGSILIAKEMLSDNDPFHNRILKQIQNAEDELRKQINHNNKFNQVG